MVVLIVSFAFGLGFLVRRLGLPPLVGFLLAGFALKAVGVDSSPAVQKAADLGVTLLMFTIGLKLNLRTLARPMVWGGTLVHTALTTVLCTAALLGFGAAGLAALAGPSGPELRAAILIGLALCFSSTVFAVKMLEHNGDSTASFGKISIGVLIMQDLVAVGFLVVSAGSVPAPMAVALILLLPARPLLHRLAVASGHGELLVLCGLFLAVVVGYAAFDFTGVKGDLGALAVGVLVGGHPKSKELADTLFELKELLLIGFFLNIGLSGALTWASVGTAALLLLLLPIKVVLYFLVLTRFGLRARGSTLAALILASYSEFGLIVTDVGVDIGWLAEHWLVTVALALSASLVIASPINTRGYRIYERLAGRLRRFERPAAMPRVARVDLGDVDAIVFGMGRVGSGAYDTLAAAMAERVVGIDHDLEKVERLRTQGRRVLHGDGIDHEFWDELHADLAGLHLVVLALHDHASNLEVLRLLRRHDYAGVVAAIARYPDEIDELRRAGAQAVHNFYTEAGVGLADHALRAMEAERAES